MELPSGLLNKFSVAVFNRAYFSKHGKAVKRGIAHPQSFFYPLDQINDWNRIYGRRGFVQYQCVVPKEDAQRSAERLLNALATSGNGSFLSVIKDCGAEGKGMISFPRPGISLAFDLPMRGDATRSLVRKLNEVVLEVGGRIYLAKDALTEGETYRAMDPRWEAWNEVRKKWDPHGKLRSALSVRIFGD